MSDGTTPDSPKVSILDQVLAVAFQFSIPVLLLLTTVSVAIRLPFFYEEAFTRHTVKVVVDSRTLEPDELTDIGLDVRRYFFDDRANLDIEVRGTQGPVSIFPEKEIVHMRDVKRVVTYLMVLHKTLLVLGIAYLIYCLRRWDGLGRNLGWVLVASTFLTFSMPIALGALIVFDFDAMFADFHGIFFEAGSWIMTDDSPLILLFPQSYWIESAAILMGVTGLGAILSGGFGVLILKRTPPHPDDPRIFEGLLTPTRKS